VAQRRFTSVAQKVYVVVTVPLLTMSLTILALYYYTPRYQAALANPMNSIAVPEQVPVKDIVMPTIPVAIPEKITINKISVSSYVQPVGLTPQGNMDIDDDPKQAAWYRNGPKPGEQGSAVIAGHYGWKDGVPSVFNDLHTLVPGDEIAITYDNGSMMKFAVDRLVTYSPTQDATDVFRSDDSQAHLNLVTCQGTWNTTGRTYSERLVVFTHLIVQ
jgi:sortase A